MCTRPLCVDRCGSERTVSQTTKRKSAHRDYRYSHPMPMVPCSMHKAVHRSTRARGRATHATTALTSVSSVHTTVDSSLSCRVLMRL